MLGKVVSIMTSLDLNFVQDRLETGQLTLILSPSLEPFVKFSDSLPSDLPAPRYGVRQMIQKELESFRVKKKQEELQEEASSTGGVQGEKNNNYQTTAQKAMKVYRKDGGSGRDPKQPLGSKLDKGKILKDFFGRVIVPREVETGPSKLGDDGEEHEGEEERRSKKMKFDKEDGSVKSERALKIYYRYNEGSSNAVRRPVKLYSLL